MGWRIVLIVISLLMVSVLELGKHTLWGWVIAAALILCFWILKAKHTFGEIMASRWICSFFCLEKGPGNRAVTVDFSRNLSNYSDYFNEGGVRRRSQPVRSHQGRTREGSGGHPAARHPPAGVRAVHLGAGKAARGSVGIRRSALEQPDRILDGRQG